MTVQTLAAGREVPLVLVIEDDPAIAELVQTCLERAGLQVRWAGDGLAGLEMIAAERPDAVVLDLAMPRLDGLSVLRRLHATPGLDAIPVMVISARADGPAVNAALDSGARDYLVKPFEGGALTARVRGLLPPREAEPFLI